MRLNGTVAVGGHPRASLAAKGTPCSPLEQEHGRQRDIPRPGFISQLFSSGLSCWVSRGEGFSSWHYPESGAGGPSCFQAKEEKPQRILVRIHGLLQKMAEQTVCNKLMTGERRAPLGTLCHSPALRWAGAGQRSFTLWSHSRKTHPKATCVPVTVPAGHRRVTAAATSSSELGVTGSSSLDCAPCSTAEAEFGTPRG